jgi:hypothetical protein
MANRGDPEVAPTLSAAGALIQAHRFLRNENEHTVARVRRLLAPAVIDAAFAKGARMSHEQIVAFLPAELGRAGSSKAGQWIPPGEENACGRSSRRPLPAGEPHRSPGPGSRLSFGSAAVPGS